MEKFQSFETIRHHQTANKKSVDGREKDGGDHNVFEHVESVEGISEILIEKSKYVSEGDNGVINVVNTSDLPEPIKKSLEKKYAGKFENFGQRAIKMLKIYIDGAGRREFEAQKTAYEIVSADVGAAKELAKIPEPIFHCCLNIEKSGIREILRREGINVGQNKIEVFLMDYIRGEDLAELLYKEVIRRHGGFEYLEKDFDKISLRDLQAVVAGILHFEKPGGKHFSKGMKNFEQEMVNFGNIKKIISFLQKKGYVLDKLILDKLEKTVKLLNAHGLRHRDLHERNIMVAKDDSGNIQDVFIVDFGRAVQDDESEYGDEENGEKFFRDDTIVRRYGLLTKTIQEDFGEQAAVLKKELMTLADGFVRGAAWEKFEKELAADASAENFAKCLDDFVYKTAGYYMNDGFWKIKSAAIIKISGQHIKLARQYIENILNEKSGRLSGFGRQLLTKIYEFIV